MDRGAVITASRNRTILRRAVDAHFGTWLTSDGSSCVLVSSAVSGIATDINWCYTAADIWTRYVMASFADAQRCWEACSRWTFCTSGFAPDCTADAVLLNAAKHTHTRLPTYTPCKHAGISPSDSLAHRLPLSLTQSNLLPPPPLSLARTHNSPSMHKHNSYSAAQAHKHGTKSASPHLR